MGWSLGSSDHKGYVSLTLDFCADNTISTSKYHYKYLKVLWRNRLSGKGLTTYKLAKKKKKKKKKKRKKK